jgi:purine-binding chemotaxis protein CheW
MKFDLAELEYTPRTCIIVVQIQGEHGPMMMGIVVDGVSEVLSFVAADIEDTPDFGQGVTTPYILGMAKGKGKVKILLDIDQVLTTKELKGLSSLIQ